MQTSRGPTVWWGPTHRKVFMKIWAFDPGAVATGLAWLDKDEDMWAAAQFANPQDAYRIFDREYAFDDVVLIEDYSHGGAFTREAKETVEIVGFLKHALGYVNSQTFSNDIPVFIRHKDKRLSGQAEAAALMGGTTVDLKKDPENKDAFSALAHACVFRRELNGSV